MIIDTDSSLISVKSTMTFDGSNSVLCWAEQHSHGACCACILWALYMHQRVYLLHSRFCTQGRFENILFRSRSGPIDKRLSWFE